MSIEYFGAISAILFSSLFKWGEYTFEKERRRLLGQLARAMIRIARGEGRLQRKKHRKRPRIKDRKKIWREKMIRRLQYHDGKCRVLRTVWILLILPKIRLIILFAFINSMYFYESIPGEEVPSSFNRSNIWLKKKNNSIHMCFSWSILQVFSKYFKLWLF